ncbi:MAG: undecaprenyl/decaprenyl-phosphate alpha-N-acetylglucosaminyl 1-phosphate transferase [Chloroflexi bacterium]|nr:undecaprenyl/decaprenyl-phosphate alpha-N-acetylglucosaminyl 1-phosphate transferase [Chloroflexota bacterium]
MSLPASFGLIGGVAWLTAFAITPLVARLARRWGVLDIPDTPRRVHDHPIPRLGGIALYLAFLLAVAVGIFIPLARHDPNEITRLEGLLLGGTLAVLVGLWDDKRALGPWTQLAAQIAIALVGIRFLLFIEVTTNPLTGRQIWFPWPVTLAITLVWLVGMMNTVNWLDGLDGLADGVVAIICLVLFLHMWRLGQYSVALLPLALLGATLGFLPYNFHPARVFMGSSGSLFLGFAAGALSIMAGAKLATALLVLGVPILDVAWLIITRIRRGVSPMEADRGHLHHRLYDIGLSQRRVVLLYYAICAGAGALALLLPSPLDKLLALLILGALALSLLGSMARRRET